jgi:FkbM family methyltransferase
MIVKVRGMQFSVRDEYLEQDQSIVNDIFIKDGYHSDELKNKIANPQCILDIGGHIGIFGLLASQLWPETKIYAFEPNPHTYTIYRKNIAINKLSNILLFNSAVTTSKEKNSIVSAVNQSTITFLASAQECDKLYKGMELDNAVFQIFHNSFGPFKKVGEVSNIITLDEIVDKYSLDSIDLLKIDCEGSEVDILCNATSSTASKIRAIIGEYHIHGGYKSFCKLVKAKYPHLLCFKKDQAMIGSLLSIFKLIFFHKSSAIGHFNAFG